MTVVGMAPEVIETDRLVLRPWAFEDVADLLSYADDDEWGRYLPVPRPYHEADARRFIAAQVLDDRQERPSWAIEHGGRVVGGINLCFLCRFRIGELGYSVARACWGRGLATEAVRAIIDLSFESHPTLLRIQASADPRNVASVRVLEKLGMKREGLLRSNNFLRGQPVDEVWCGILRSEWEGRRTPR
jgi:ribosomal-protein-alanine N-acetyltransferase